MKIKRTGKNEYTVYSQKDLPMGTYKTLLDAHKRTVDVTFYMSSKDKKEKDTIALKEEFGII